ncbi:MAG TPA: hypothetical protein VI434_00860 [Candidatus Dormibacteraeota bacterium]
MALPVTPLLVEDSAAALAVDGWQYTQRQLYYATCAKAETPASNAASNGEIGLGVLLILVGLILIGIKVAFVLFVSLGVALVLTGIIGRLRRPVLVGRVLALSFDEFKARFGDLRPAGLIDPAAALPTPDANAAGGTTIICDTTDTASLVAANLAHVEVGSVMVVAAKDGSADAPNGRAIVLHDASPRGCALVLNLRDEGIAAEDAGLRPSDVDGPSHQVIEGAPARLPRDLSTLLRRDEIDWLLSGRRVEVATLTSEVAMASVLAAIRRLDPSRGDDPQQAG